MSVLNVKKRWATNSISTFVKDFGVKKEFKELTGKDIEEYDNEEADCELIEKILNKHFPNSYYYVDYDEDCDMITIVEFDLPGTDFGNIDNDSQLFRKLKRDVVISMTEKGDLVGVYFAGTDGKHPLIECSPEKANKVINAWNREE